MKIISMTKHEGEFIPYYIAIVEWYRRRAKHFFMRSTYQAEVTDYMGPWRSTKDGSSVPISWWGKLDALQAKMQMDNLDTIGVSNK